VVKTRRRKSKESINLLKADNQTPSLGFSVNREVTRVYVQGDRVKREVMRLS